jgi:hypothetical protein
MQKHLEIAYKLLVLKGLDRDYIANRPKSKILIWILKNGFQKTRMRSFLNNKEITASSTSSERGFSQMED